MEEAAAYVVLSQLDFCDVSDLLDEELADVDGHAGVLVVVDQREAVGGVVVGPLPREVALGGGH